MLSFRGLAYCAALTIVFYGGGCRSVSQTTAGRTPSTRADHVRPSSVSHDQTNEDNPLEVTPVSHSECDEQRDFDCLDDPFVGTTELSLNQFILAVQARNPSLQAAQAAWAAAIERYPQVVALDDPMFQSMFAPESFASNSVQSSYYVGVAQRIPWHGKRALRGQMAQWESQAAAWDTEEVKLRLAVAARMAYFDYYLARRELELNEKNVEVMQDFRSTAKSKYEANQVSQQDLSSADLELAKLNQQRLELEQAERTAVARINTLLHRQPDCVLPAPPQRLAIQSDVWDAAVLRDLAGQHRPELAALNARIQSEQNAVVLACKEYYPDFEFMGRYDAFWTDLPQRAQVGMNMNVPIQKSRLAAAVREAQFRVSKLTAEYAQKRDTVNEEIEVAAARVNTNRKAAALFESSILPSAETNLEAARAAYVAGSIDFLRLMDARRQFIEQQIGYQRTLTEYQRSFADLERAVGTSISE